MLMVASILLGLALVAPAGGSYRRLSRAHVRWSGLFLLGAIAQFVFTPMLAGEGSRVGPTTAWVLGALLLIAACAANAQRSGFVVAALGVSLNLLVILVNTGMPVYPGALEAAGAGSFVIDPGTIYHVAHASTRLIVLADVVPVPGPPGIRSIGSLGDLLLCVGVVAAILQFATLGPSSADRPGRGSPR